MKRGFTLIEIIGALAILTIAAAVAGRLFYQTLVVIRAEQLSLIQRSAHDSLLRQLRQDALVATELSAPDGGVHLRIANKDVVYTRTQAGTLRDDGASQFRWDVPALKRLAVEGTAIHLEFEKSQPLDIMAPWASARKGRMP